MKVVDVISLPARSEVVAVDATGGMSRPIAKRVVAANGKELSEYLGGGLHNPDTSDMKIADTIAHCLNTYDTRTDLIRRLVEMLKKLQWASVMSFGYEEQGCLACGQLDDKEKHLPDCPLAALIAEAKKELE